MARPLRLEYEGALQHLSGSKTNSTVCGRFKTNKKLKKIIDNIELELSIVKG